ncbi:FAD-binding oxidoreductase [Agromyces sp. NPDC058126]|uniref:FAD-binding oxidoreductase n=1 Tax=Agromyces sp. NPDC058126 TaxID=3346350 RepID=UPI0036DDD448
MNTPVPSAAVADAAVADFVLQQHAPDIATLSLREALALLDEQLAGRVHLSGDPDWDDARAAWNLDVDQRPAVVVTARSTEDLVRTVGFGARYGLAVAPQGTGHNAGPLAADNGLADAILLRTHELRGVEIDVERRTARVEAGALWGDVVAAAAPHGLAALAGSSHDVGVVGYTLGGGVSWLARTHGLAANQVLAVEIVTADGRLRRVDEEHDSELFWAVRGGGGDFGVVTALEFRLFPITEVVAGMLLWPAERADEVAAAWADWTNTVPDAVQSVVRIMHLPPLPELPPFLSGRSVVIVEAVVLDSPARADELLAPLRALAPELDTVHPQSPAELLALHMDPPGPVPGRGDGMMLRELPPAAVRAFVGAVGADSGTALLSTEIRHLGGAVEPDAAVQRAADLGLPVPGATAGFEANYLVFAGAMAMPGADEAIARSLGRLFSQIEPWRAPEEYLNFAEQRRDATRFFGGRLARLRALKRAVDPTRVIRSNHPVG